MRTFFKFDKSFLFRFVQEENERLKLLIDTGKYNMQLDIRPGMTSQDVEQMRREMEEEILSQIQNNQQILQDSKTSWESKVRFCYKHLFILVLVVSGIHRTIFMFTFCKWAIEVLRNPLCWLFSSSPFFWVPWSPDEKKNVLIPSSPGK